MRQGNLYYPAGDYPTCHVEILRKNPHTAKFFSAKGANLGNRVRVDGREYVFPNDFRAYIEKTIKEAGYPNIHGITLVVSAGTAVALALAGIITPSNIEQAKKDIVPGRLWRMNSVDENITIEVYEKKSALRKAKKMPKHVLFNFRKFVQNWRHHSR